MTDPQIPEQRPETWRTDEQWGELRQRIRASAASEGLDRGIEIDPGHPDQWRMRRWMTYAGTAAAAACLTFAVVLASRDSLSTAPMQWAQVSTGPGELDTVRLADSTLIAMGPSTSVRYAMNTSRREVELRGIASFDVTHNAARPFRVRAGNAVALDVGTRFLVRRYDTDADVRVSVSSGIVTLSDSAGATSVTLNAGRAGRVSQAGATVMDPQMDSTRTELWLRGQLQFRNVTLAEAAVQMGNWFGAAVKVPDVKLANRRVTAVYTGASLNDVLDALAATLGLSYTQKDSAVTLLPGRRND